ncbi:hypothetical protein [Shinella sp. BYT-45]|uniref:hypothetical protein n=1 Tax=Shinella sp. BYT-45 TaxID=3377377 RepID=UPI00398055A9
MTRSSHKDFRKSVAEIFTTGLKLKKVMQKKRLTRARCVCPRCGGMIHAALIGSRQHLHMACQGGCGMQMLE